MNGIKLFRIFGIDIILDLFVIVLIVLMGISLYFSFLAKFGNAVYAVIASALMIILIYFSLIWHELAHSLVGRRYGFVVKRIIIMIFGGAAIMEDADLSKAKGEFLMAIAGPISSFVLSVIFFAFAVIFKYFQFAALGSVCGGVASLNFIWAIFNLAPCFPMDGGRILRSALNGLIKDFVRATKIVFVVSNIITISVMIVCVAMFIWKGGFLYLWYVFLAWFIRSFAVTEYRAVVQNYRYKNLFVKDFTIKPPEKIMEDMHRYMPAEILSDFCCFSGDSIEVAIRKFRRYPNAPTLLVFENDELIGYIRRIDLNV